MRLKASPHAMPLDGLVGSLMARCVAAIMLLGFAQIAVAGGWVALFAEIAMHQITA